MGQDGECSLCYTYHDPPRRGMKVLSDYAMLNGTANSSPERRAAKVPVQRTAASRPLQRSVPLFSVTNIRPLPIQSLLAAPQPWFSPSPGAKPGFIPLVRSRNSQADRLAGHRELSFIRFCFCVSPPSIR